MTIKVVGAILAAGASTRLGRPKQLAVVDGLPGGETLLARTIRTARACTALDEIAVILGAHRDKITLGGAVVRIDNPDFEEGMGSSVRTAAAWAASTNAGGLLLMVCDQARLSTAHLDELLGAFDRSRRDVGSRYAGAVGVPAVFARDRFDDLMKLRGDRGARSLLVGACFVDWPDGLVDIDTEADLEDFGAKIPPYS